MTGKDLGRQTEQKPKGHTNRGGLFIGWHCFRCAGLIRNGARNGSMTPTRTRAGRFVFRNGEEINQSAVARTMQSGRTG